MPRHSTRRFLSRLLPVVSLLVIGCLDSSAVNPAEKTPGDCRTKFPTQQDKEKFCRQNPGDECCDCESCEAGNCASTAGGANGRLDSLNFTIGLGQAPHEDLPLCKLELTAEMPSASLFSPEALKVLRPFGGRVVSDVTTGLGNGVVRRVIVELVDGKSVTFDFDQFQSSAYPTGDYANTGWGLETLAADGTPTDPTAPVFYKLHFRGYPSYSRFSASTGKAVYHRTDTGRGIDAEDTQVEEIYDAGVLRQIRTAAGLADVFVDTGWITENRNVWKYTVSFYTANQVGTKQANGTYSVVGGATPHTTVTFRNPATNPDTDFGRILITRTTDTGSTQVYDYVYTAASDEWTMSRGDGTTMPVKGVVRSSWNEGRTREQEVREIWDDDDNLAAKSYRERVTFDWGTETVENKTVTEVVPVAGGEATESLLVTSRWFYDEAAGTHTRAATVTAAIGKCAAKLDPDGSWALYDYDSEKRNTLVVRPWKDLAWTAVQNLTPTQAKDLGQATEYSYASVDQDDTPIDGDARPRTITETVGGVVVGRTWHVYKTTTHDRQVHIVEHAATNTADYGDAGNRRTTTIYNGPTADDEAMGRPRTVETSDGRMDTYSYDMGTYTVNADPALCAFSSGTGDAFRTMVTHGTTASPAGIANRTTREVHVADEQGNRVLSETYVYTGTGYERIAWTVRIYDDQGHATDTYRSDGSHEEATWDCCGKSSETLADGTEHAYTYDEAGRLVIQTREAGADPALITSYTYDAADNQLSATTVAEGTGLSTGTTTAVDLAGRTVREIDAVGLLTLTAHDDANRNTTVTRPGGGTEITTTYVDGRIKSVTGTAVTPRYYDYGVDADGSRWTIVYTGPIPAGQTFADIPMWEKSWTDPLGRTVKTQRPTADAATPVATTQSFYDNQGRLVRAVAADGKQTLFEYDTALGELLRTGLDADLDGILDLATDVAVTENTAVYEKDANDDWWQVGTSKVYGVQDDDTATPGVDERTVPVTTGTRRTRLSGLGTAAPTPYTGILVSEQRSTDIHGNETVARVYLDRANATQYAVTDSPFSTIDQVRTTVGGRPVSSVSDTGLTTYYFHDGFGRTTGVTDPRISTENAGVWSNYNKTAYNSEGQVAWTEDTAGNRTTYTYDNPPENPTDAERLAATGLAILVEDALSQTVSTHYDAATGRRLAVWGATYPIRYQYDAYGRMAAMHTLRDTTLTIASYQDLLDNAASFDTTTWSYHAATGLLVAKQYADGEQTTYAYTALGQLARRTWARGVYADYAYSGAANELTAVDYSDATPDVAYAYDRVGRATAVTDAAGTRAFAYNDDGTLDAETFGTTAYLPGASVARSYDSQGRNTGFQATSFGPGGTTYTVPAATYAYDAHGRLQSVASESETFAYAYGANSPLLATVTFPNGLVTTWTYEATRHLVDHVENKVGGTAVSKYDYTNDTIGRRTNVQKSGTAFTATDTIAWGYDNRSQVTSAVAATDATYDYTYAYDPIGNRTTYVTKETGAAVTTGYTSSQLNQYTAITSRTDPTYDDDGNMTLMPAAAGDWTLAWDGENRLASAESATKRLEFVYDHMDRRIERRTYTGAPGDWTLAETRRFLYDGWHLIAEFDHQSGVNTLKSTHLWGLDLSQSVGGAGGVGGLLRTTLYSSSPTGGATADRYYPTYDANGNVSEYLDAAAAIAARHEYSPFGKLTASTGLALPFRFSTKYLDTDTSLYYYGYRYYSPELGRWLNRDPIGEEGGANVLAFVNNTVNGAIDDLGLVLVIMGPPALHGMPARRWERPQPLAKGTYDIIPPLLARLMAATEVHKEFKYKYPDPSVQIGGVVLKADAAITFAVRCCKSEAGRLGVELEAEGTVSVLAAAGVDLDFKGLFAPEKPGKTAFSGYRGAKADWRKAKKAYKEETREFKAFMNAAKKLTKRADFAVKGIPKCSREESALFIDPFEFSLDLVGRTQLAFYGELTGSVGKCEWGKGCNWEIAPIGELRTKWGVGLAASLYAGFQGKGSFSVGGVFYIE